MRRRVRIGAIPTWLVPIAVVGSALAIGAVHVEVLLGVFVICFAAALLVLMQGERRFPAPAAIAGILALFTAFQALPLPHRFVSAIASRNAEIWTRTLDLIGGGQSHVSLDPGASWVEATKWLAYAFVFFVAARVGSRRGAIWGARVAFVSAGILATITVLHGLASASKLYGIYSPTFSTRQWTLGPLLNSNNLAGYLNFGAMCGLGVLLSVRSPVQRVACGLGIAGVLGVAALAASRGALLALPIGLAVFVVLVLRNKQRPTHASPRFVWLATAATLVGGGLLAILGATRGTWAEIADRSTAKLRIVGWVGPMIKDHKWLGTGRGAFETVFPAYDAPTRDLLFAHAENLVAQWGAEWGVPVALAGLMAFAWTLRPKALGADRDSAAAGVAAGLVATVCHNMFDLALEVPAVCIVLAAATGAAWGARNRESRRGESVSESSPPRRYARVFAVGVMGLAVFVTTTIWGRNPAQLDRAKAQRAYAGTNFAQEGSRALLESALREAMRRHPADPYFPRLMAATAWRGKTGEALHWLSLSLERDLWNGRSHLLLARVLRSRGALRQALFELRLATEAEPGLGQKAGWLAVSWTRDPGELARAVPDGPRGVPMLMTFASALSDPKEIFARERVLTLAIEHDPRDPVPRATLVRDLIREIGDPKGRCADTKSAECSARAEEQIAQLERLPTADSRPAELRAEWLMVTGKPGAAVRLLAERCPPRSVSCADVRLRAAARTGRPEVESALVAMETAACPPPHECAQTLTLAGDYLAGSAPDLALGCYRKAIQQEPTETRWQKLSIAATRAGLHGEAALAEERVARLRGRREKEIPSEKMRVDPPNPEDDPDDPQQKSDGD